MERYFREGKIKEVADYCETDVINTYRVWLRYELFRGSLSQGAFETSQLNLYRVPEIVTRGRFPDGGESDSTWRTQEARHVGSDTIAPGF